MSPSMFDLLNHISNALLFALETEKDEHGQKYLMVPAADGYALRDRIEAMIAAESPMPVPNPEGDFNPTDAEIQDILGG